MKLELMKPFSSRAVALGALVLAFLVFSPTLRYALVYDDLNLIAMNPRLTAWKYVPGYFTTHLWANIPFEAPNYYRPLFLLWLRFTYATLGAPGPLWHVVSILAHLAATISVFVLARYLTRSFKGAGIAAGLFALHPIHTEAVAWVSCVSEPVLTTFLVLSLYFYARRNTQVSWVSLLLATLAMFTKETGIVAPALILVYEWTRSNFKNAVFGSAPYVLPAFLFVACRITALGHFGLGVPPSMSVVEMLQTLPRVVVAYAAHLLWPVHLSISYNVPVESASWPLLALIVVGVFLASVTHRCSANLQLGITWFVITLAPALNIRYLFAGDFVHDRYLYLPSVGLALMAAVWFSRDVLTPPRVALGAVLTTALCLGTISNLRIWKDETSLFERAVETAPNNPYQKNNLANAYLRVHREREALPLLMQAISLNPDYALAYYNLARYYQMTGNYEQASRLFIISRRALEESQPPSGY